MKITAELRAQARMIADAPEGAELQERHISEDEWIEPSMGGSVMLNHDDFTYRLKPEPRTIFVNEYDGYVCARENKEDAINAAGPQGIGVAKRIAVEYREVVK